jgi:hypothetical protein
MSLKNRSAGTCLNLVATAFALIALVAYTIAGKDSYGFVPLVDVLLAAGIASAVIFTARDFFECGSIITMILFAAGFSVFLKSRFMYYSHQYYGIASDPITPAMIVTTAAMIGMILFEMAAGFLRWGRKGEQK